MSSRSSLCFSFFLSASDVSISSQQTLFFQLSRSPDPHVHKHSWGENSWVTFIPEGDMECIIYESIYCENITKTESRKKRRKTMRGRCTVGRMTMKSTHRVLHNLLLRSLVHSLTHSHVSHCSLRSRAPLRSAALIRFLARSLTHSDPELM